MLVASLVEVKIQTATSNRLTIAFAGYQTDLKELYKKIEASLIEMHQNPDVSDAGRPIQPARHIPIAIVNSVALGSPAEEAVHYFSGD
jgi:hypothetical protein